MKIAFLGLGNMGLPLAQNILRADHDLTVWNRSPDKGRSIASQGAGLAENAAGAVKDADLVFTMLNDDHAVEEVVFGAGSEGSDGFLKSMKAGAIHVSLSTISVALSKKLTGSHTEFGSGFVAAPVFGRPNVAAEGKLWIVVGGSDEHLAHVRPVLEQISRGITVVADEQWRANALKIGGNYLITAMIESLSEAMVFAEAQGIDATLFLDTVNNALFRSPFYEAYGKVMLNPPEKPGATIGIGVKDMGLFVEAARDAGIATPLADRFAKDLATAAEAGLKDSDWAAGLYQFARNTNARKEGK